MRRWTGSLLAALLMAVPLTAEDKKAEDKGKDREQQFEELRTSFDKASKEALQAYRSAKTEEDQKAAIEKFQNAAKQVPKVMKLIEADPKDDLAFRMLAWELKVTQGQEPKVFNLLAEYHTKNPGMVDVCRSLAFRPPPESAKMLRKTLADNPEKSAKGCACYALAQLADSEAAGGDPSKATEAEKLYERVGEEFADVKSGRDSTLGELAKIESKLLVGKTAPDIKSEDLEGEKVQLKDYRGKVVVLDIWATWCGPCRAMIPDERKMVEKFKDKPFALIGINFDRQKNDVKKFLEKEAMPWKHWFNGLGGGITKEWNITHWPTIYVLDAKGVIRYKEIRGKPLEDAVEKLLAEGNDKK